jgi:ribonucleoside-diphosphate reductase beta chain
VIERIAERDPELAARLVVMALPAAASRIPATLAYDLTVEELGTWRVSVADGRARVDPVTDGAVSDHSVDFRLSTDARTLVEMARGGTSPLRLLVGGRLRIRGKRRRARKLAAMANGPEPTMSDILAAGGRVDPELVLRTLPYLIDPEWTKGHRFTVAYEVDGAARWLVEVRDGEPLRVSAEGDPDAVVRMSLDTYQRMVARELTPDTAMQRRLTVIDGQIHPVTLLGRWIDRSQGLDDAEMERERAQRETQERRSAPAARLDGDGQGDPGQGSKLLDYRQLYVLWERQNWKAHELDFSVDKEQWLTTPRVSQESTIWSLGSFYVGEERVTADLAPFLRAAPSGEIELFLATQLVDEARHAAFFDRFGAEVMALEAELLRDRMREVSERLTDAWSHVFDDGLRDVSKRIQAKPDDLDLFVEGITTYHLVIEGLLAVTGQKFIREYMLEHGLYPGFCEGFGLVERDEHRHIAFGVRFLKDAIEYDRRHAQTVERTVLRLTPSACHVFCPPYADDPRDFTSYGYHSSEVYGYAYRTLKRRMAVLGLQLPPAEELMPGPIDEPERLAGAEQPLGVSQNGEGGQANGHHPGPQEGEQQGVEPGHG